jgi:ectoine hydroxylase-related dioxygenase (phytanoyl-CoA dioxygenase family)
MSIATEPQGAAQDLCTVVKERDVDLQLTEAQLGSLEDQGFLVVPGLCSREEAAEIRSILEDLFERRVGEKEGAQFDVLKPGSTDSRTLVQLNNPMNYAHALLKTQHTQNAHSIARQILGPNAILSATLVLMKPAHCGSATPWHQDEAFRGGDKEFEELTIWTPLQDVNNLNGCMQFVPGSHKGDIRPHHSPGDDLKSHGLELCELPAPENIVSCPMPAGYCTIHYSRTLHGTPGNASDTARFAYIMIFQTPPRPAPETRHFPWLLEKQNVDDAVREKWFRRGGFIITAWRTFRRGDFSSMAGIKVNLLRAMGHLRKKTTR